ncbi:MAG: PTS sugar transporter subunit IIC, partial [Thermotogaceae bacterium]|nr:PTS sugar transporter subunit IIC [Thermotogaceae bacterium]
MKPGAKNLRSFFIQSLNGMALGLFSSLIIGLIIKQIGDYAQIDLITRFGRFA